MKLDTLFDNYDLFMDASNAVPKMRDLILQLAVRGKLVERDPTDEPAGELLKRIKAEKKKLISEGKIKKQKPFLPITKDEIPYELPQGWTWVRLGEIGLTQTGSTPPTSKREYYGNDYAFIKPADISGKGVRYEGGVGLSKKGIEKGRFVKAYSVLMVCIGGSIGKVNFVDRDCSCNQQINAVTPCNDVDFRIVNYNLASPYFQNQVLTNAPSTTLPILNKGKWNNIPFSLPPIAEQKRIISKVDQLMQLCDQLDACQEKASTKYTSLNDAALEKLLSAKTIDEFANHWQFICNNFDLIYNDPAHVNKLRQAILQFAVQGKLATQDLNDEPASELLKRIKAEKEKLIAEGKIKKQKPLPPIGEDEKPFELPEGWEWVRLGELAVNIHYGFTASANNSVYDVRLLRITDIQNNKVNWNTVPGCEIHDTEIVKYALKDNDILIARTGGTIGKSFIVKKIPVKAVFASYLIRVIPWEILDADYMKLFLESPMYWTQLFEKSMGTGQPNVNASSLKQLKITLPPLTEQKGIVAKVDQLMHFCDDLETRLNQSKKDSEMLMQTVLHDTIISRHHYFY